MTRSETIKKLNIEITKLEKELEQSRPDSFGYNDIYHELNNLKNWLDDIYSEMNGREK